MVEGFQCLRNLYVPLTEQVLLTKYYEELIDTSADTSLKYT
jgi:hypothetical protein